MIRAGWFCPDGVICSRILSNSSARKLVQPDTARDLRCDIAIRTIRPKPDTINVLNGLLDVNTGALSPHSPEYLSPLSTVHVPVEVVLHRTRNARLRNSIRSSPLPAVPVRSAP